MRSVLTPPPLLRIWRDEFRGYNAASFRADLLAGITVAAVALPLALAFGIASGASPAAGLVTAILAGILIGGLGGAGYQVSGPTGAMSAVLIVLAGRFGLEGMWVAGLLAGVIILLLGVFDLGQIVNFIPTAVISGFTSGIALIIFIGQIDNLLGVKTAPAENSLLKLIQYFRFDYAPNWAAVGISLLVIAIMLLWPKKWGARFPGSLLGLIVATLVVVLFNLNIAPIGAIPQTIILDQRLLPSTIPWEHLGDLIAPALSIAALGAIESLLCGTVAGKMVNQKMASNQELMAQGLGNIIIPFFGGVPATAAIARTSVAIKSGGKTRVVSIIHSLVLLLAALVLAPIMARIPMAALAGVLAVTAWRMNDWAEIRQIFGRRFKSAMFAFVSTMIATVALDLTQAIIIGVGLSAVIFVFQISKARITVSPVSAETMRKEGYELQTNGSHIAVVYFVGPLFFGTSSVFNQAMEDLNGAKDVILSMRAVPLLDTTGIAAVEELIQRVETKDGRVYLSGLNDPVFAYLQRAGILNHIGEDRVFWSADQAIIAADRYRAGLLPPEKEMEPAPV